MKKQVLNREISIKRRSRDIKIRKSVLCSNKRRLYGFWIINAKKWLFYIVDFLDARYMVQNKKLGIEFSVILIRYDSFLPASF